KHFAHLLKRFCRACPSLQVNLSSSRAVVLGRVTPLARFKRTARLLTGRSRHSSDTFLPPNHDDHNSRPIFWNESRGCLAAGRSSHSNDYVCAQTMDEGKVSTGFANLFHLHWGHLSCPLYPRTRHQMRGNVS